MENKDIKESIQNQPTGLSETIKAQGYVEIIVQDSVTGEIIKVEKKNTVLVSGKATLARLLANDVSGVYVQNMIFGQGGEDGNVPKVVDSGRTSLFSFISGTSTTVSSGWTSDYPTRATFSATLNSSTANGSVINEAALELSNGDLFSMITFGGLTKTSSLNFTLNWNLLII
jgi:hypothetical protein